MRCLALAEYLQEEGSQCYFVIRSDNQEILSIIRNKGFFVFQLRLSHEVINCRSNSGEPEHAHWLGVDWATDAADTNSVLNDLKIDWIIVDHYGLDMKWEKSLRGNGRLLMVIDDLADRHHDCDLLIDPGVDSSLYTKYQTLTTSNCVRLIGPKYAILRREFAEYKKSINFEKRLGVPKNIVVMFGGSDSDQSTLQVLHLILKLAPPKTKVEVIVALINVNKDLILDFCNLHTMFRPHIASSEIALILSRADFAIGSGGGATYERLFLGLPALLKVVAKNQLKPLQYMQSINLISLYETEDELHYKLVKVFRDGVKRPPNIVQDGVPVICDWILNKLIGLNSPLPRDVRQTFKWLQHEGLRNQFLMSEQPQRRGHFHYWRNLLSDTSQKVFSIYFKNQHIGNAGIKNIDLKKDQSELWLYIGETIFQGVGHGKVVLTALEKIIHKELLCSRVVLHVSKNNNHAYHFYIRNGYTVTVDDIATSKFRSIDQVVCMEKLF